MTINSSPTFSISNGIVHSTDNGHYDYQLLVQNDGKVDVLGLGYVGKTAGYSILKQFNANGALDTSYVNNGFFAVDSAGESYYRDPYNDYASPMSAKNSLATQADGKTLLASTAFVFGGYFRGYSDFQLSRYTANGVLDSSFGGDGRASVDFGAYDFSRAVAIQSDGKIVQAGDYHNGSYGIDIALVRYNPDGSLDSSFDTDGKLTMTVGYAAKCNGVAIQADGKILVTGSADNNLFLIRYNSDGSLDTSFSEDGIVRDLLGITSGRAVSVTNDGKILVVGATADGFGLARYNADGSLDASFNTDNTLDGAPSATEPSTAVVLDSDVRIYDAELALADSYAGAWLSLMRHGGANGDDVFSSTGNLSLVDGVAVLSGVTIGSVDNLTGELTIHFNADATQARVNEALSSLTYRNSAYTPPNTIQLDWRFNDGNTGAQGTGDAQSTTGVETVKLVDIKNGTLGNDALLGGAGRDELNGYSGNDTLNGGLDADKLNGGSGNDVYRVDNVYDIVSESRADGIDQIQASISYSLMDTDGAGGNGGNVENLRLLGTDAINATGNDLNNLLYANVANNILSGGNGIDTVSYYYGATSGVNVNLALNSAQSTGGSGQDTLSGVENLTGSTYHDKLIGNAFANTLAGELGNDTLVGGGGNDNISGGLGNDILTGGAGKDSLGGGAGKDTFDFNALSELGNGKLTCDVIADFARGQDKIDLSGIDANPTLSGDQAFTWVTKAFSAAGQLRYLNGMVLINSDNDAAAEYQIQLAGTVPATLAASDFLL